MHHETCQPPKGRQSLIPLPAEHSERAACFQVSHYLLHNNTSTQQFNLQTGHWFSLLPDSVQNNSSFYNCSALGPDNFTVLHRFISLLGPRSSSWDWIDLSSVRLPQADKALGWGGWAGFATLSIERNILYGFASWAPSKFLNILKYVLLCCTSKLTSYSSPFH